jgi:hypothetical protein
MFIIDLPPEMSLQIGYARKSDSADVAIKLKSRNPENIFVDCHFLLAVVEALRLI